MPQVQSRQFGQALLNRGVLLPPRLGRPCDADVREAIGHVAGLVADDMAASTNLDEQRARTGLGELLINPWPVSRLDAGPSSAPALAAEFLPYVGDYSAYRDALASTNVNQAQKRHIVAVVQASGSGKTRLAYADGIHSRLVVLGRVWKQKQSFTPAWTTYVELGRHWASVLPSLEPVDHRRVSQAALASMRLLAACHVRFVADVLSTIAARRAAAGHQLHLTGPGDDGAQFVRQAALRCLRNDKGDDAVGAMFLQQLSAMVSEETVRTTRQLRSYHGHGCNAGSSGSRPLL